MTEIAKIEVLPTGGLSYKDLISAFLADQDVKPKSRRTYQRTLRQFFNWVQAEGLDMASLQLPNLIDYKNHLLTERINKEGKPGLTPLTVSAYVVAVKLFYAWTESKGLYHNISKGLKTPKKQGKGFKKYPLTLDQIGLLLGSMENETVTGKRDFAILNLLLRTGLRTIELVRANVEDIDFLQGERVLFIQGKGKDSKDAYVVLTPKAWKPIKDYLQARGQGVTIPGSSPLFAGHGNRSRGQLTTRTIRRLVKTYLRGVDIDSPKITAHSFRHTAAVNSLRAGASLHETQLFMRHSDPKTTQIYSGVFEEELRLKEAPEKRLETLF